MAEKSFTPVTEYININNSRQNIMTMSTNADNPVLLIVHGGPGCPDRPLVLNCSSELASYYTVVCWDQRGSGLSYTREHLSVDIMIDDLKAVTEYLREKYNREKIYVAGHSWGAYLALRFVSMYPEYVKYYIGTGQEISVIKSEADRYRFVKESAEKKKDVRTLRKLERFGEPDGYHYNNSDSKAKAFIAKKIVLNPGYFSKSGDKSMAGYITLYLRLYLSCYGTGVFKLVMGIVKSLTTLYKEMDLNDSISGITELEVPVVLISGEEDMICPVPTAQRWFDSLKAPEKEFYKIANASHMVNFEKSQEWNRIVLSLLEKQSET